MLRFFKMQACGNDFVFLDCRSQTVPAPECLARRLCDRRFGVGGDGLVLLSPAEGVDLAMRIFNPDDTEAEMCGNAIRCAARYAWDRAASHPYGGRAARAAPRPAKCRYRGNGAPLAPRR